MYQKELQIAIAAVKKAELTFRKYFGIKTGVKKKGGNRLDLVSYADRKIESDTKKFLLKKFPKYGFIGEEHGHHNSASEYVWALDPIDGTSNYIQGLPTCAISLALLKNQKPVVGVVYAPMLDQIYTAAKGSGAKLNKKTIKSSQIKKLLMAYGSVGWGRDIPFAIKMLPIIVPKIRKFRVPGSAALGICYVASGAYDFWLAKNMNLWDYAAGQIIVEEAGGKFIRQQDLQIAANKTLIPRLSKLLK